MTPLAITAVQLRDYPDPEGKGRELYGMCTTAGPTTKLWRDELGWVHIQLAGQARIVAVPPEMVRRVDYATVSPVEAALASGFLSPEAAATYLSAVENALVSPEAVEEPARAAPTAAASLARDEVPLGNNPATTLTSAVPTEPGQPVEYFGIDRAADALSPKPLSICPHCEKVCADTRGLAAHVRAKHGGAK